MLDDFDKFAFLDRAKTKRVLNGLLDIAETAMPDSYFETDRRVKAAKRLLKELEKK